MATGCSVVPWCVTVVTGYSVRYLGDGVQRVTVVMGYSVCYRGDGVQCGTVVCYRGDVVQCALPW